ncbi:MAG: ATP synthase F0 subunit B [Terracidiphilus sp.]|jgi:F-type H+-transporting ATPase subunit b
MHASRFSRRIVSILLFAFLTASIPAVSVRANSQQPAPAAKSSAAGANSVDKTIAKSGATENAAEDENVYRHTPMVRSLARLFHLDVETTARLFEFFNFAIIVLAIIIPLARLMPRIMRKRSETLKHDLESARKLTQDANARLSAVEAKLAKLDQEIAGIRVQVEEESKNDEVRIKATIQEESGRIVASAEQEIALAGAQAQRELRHFAADLAIEQAVKQMVLTPESDRALIAEFVGNVAKGEQN